MGNSFLEKLLSTHTHQASLFLRRFTMYGWSIYLQSLAHKNTGGDNKCNEPKNEPKTNDGAKSGGGGDKAPEKK